MDIAFIKNKKKGWDLVDTHTGHLAEFVEWVCEYAYGRLTKENIDLCGFHLAKHRRTHLRDRAAVFFEYVFYIENVLSGIKVFRIQEVTNRQNWQTFIESYMRDELQHYNFFKPLKKEKEDER